MTTTLLLRPRTPLQTLSMNQPVQRRKSKRGSAYDEEDDGFRFTRATKRAKVEASVPEPVAPVPAQAAARKTITKIVEDEPIAEKKKTAPRRTMNFSTPRGETKQKAPPRQGTRKSARLSIENQEPSRIERSRNGASVDVVEDDNIEMVGAHIAKNKPKTRRTPQNAPLLDRLRTDHDTSVESTKIALPFSDTPVINRNKEFRKTNGGRRRSSLGSRGRRASSLIDSGHSAIPHQEVHPAEFYKHIESEGPSEPRRMKQLLMWCGERALGPKPAHNHPDSVALLSARPVQEQILKAFATSSEMSDWFNREEPPAKPAAPKKPNPLDAQNEGKIEDLEAKIKKMKLERDQWRSLMKLQPPPSPLFDASGEGPSPTSLDSSLLDPEEQAILESLKSSSSISLHTSAKESLQSLQKDLEFQVDQFADGIHKLTQARLTMEKVAEKVMALSATRLEEREKAGKERLGTKDVPIQEVLRALSRIGGDDGR